MRRKGEEEEREDEERNLRVKFCDWEQEEEQSSIKERWRK